MIGVSSPPAWRTRFHAWSHNDLSDPLERRLYPLLFYTAVALGAIDLLGLVVSLFLQMGGIGWGITQTLYSGLITVSVAALWLARRGAFRAAVILIVLGLLTIQALGLASLGLVFGSIMLPAMMTAVVFAGLMLTWRTATAISIVDCAIVAMIAAWQITTGQVTGEMRATTISNAFVFTCLIAFVLVIVVSFRRALEMELRETLAREHDVRMARDLLQTQVEARTADLQIALAESNTRADQLSNMVEALERSEAAVQLLSTPIIPVMTGVLLVPLAGSLGKIQAEQTANRILQSVSAKRTRTLIIDLTGVAVLDTDHIASLMRVARAARMMGVMVVLVGIGPEIVQHIVALQMHLDVATFATLEQAITAIQRR